MGDTTTTQLKQLRQGKKLELLIRKNALKDVEVWLNKQYYEIEEELTNLTKGE